MNYLIACPNCGATMNRGDACPECEHFDGGGCCCEWCGEEDAAEWVEDDWNDDLEDDDDE